ncbi:MAG: DUF4830 domain-containing protein [Ruminococcaceae bacterium]|nr:DUF4830 domain-containing protein [Oscillospiraceae bacterium]
MFVYTMRAGTIKFFAVVGVALALLVTLIVLVPTYDGDFSAMEEVSYQYGKIKSNDDVESFLSQFGWKVEDEPLEEVKVTIPDEFDKVFTAYNEIQRRQGLNLSKYKRKEVTRYTYTVTNYEGYDGKVYANVLVYRNRVVGGDICSADTTGFIHGFEKE